jgi:7-cyano-7-deazaguanine synthase
MSKAIVLLSGGQDSATSLYWARIHFDKVVALSIFYGQRHRVELDAAREIANLAAVSHRVLDASILASLSSSALVDSSRPLMASGGASDVAAPQGLPSSFVPGRNALFLTLAAIVAVQEGAKDVVAGVCQTDYSGYPDCRHEFIDAQAKALTLAFPSSVGPLRIHTPLMWMTKAETVLLARRIPGCWEALAKTVTCYEGRPVCGVCPACILRAKGFAEAGVADPMRSE